MYPPKGKQIYIEYVYLSCAIDALSICANKKYKLLLYKRIY